MLTRGSTGYRTEISRRRDRRAQHLATVSMQGAKLAADAAPRTWCSRTTEVQYLSGKPIRYYRPRGSADIRHLIDEGFQAFNAARLGEACRIFTRQDAAARARHDDCADARRRDDAGGAWRLHRRADGARAGRLRHQHRRQPLPRPALRAELHAASRLAVRQRRRAVRRRRHPHLRRAVSGDGAARRPTPTSATSWCGGA